MPFQAGDIFCNVEFVLCGIHQRLYSMAKSVLMLAAVAGVFASWYSFFCCRFCCHRCCCRYWQCLRPLHAMPWLCQPCNVSCCIWKELSEYTNEEYENEEICIVNCRFFVCFILFVLTMFSLLFFTCTHFMFSLRVFLYLLYFRWNKCKKNCGRCMPCIIFFLLFIVHNIFFESFWIFFFHLSCSSLHHFMLYFILFHIFFFEYAL